MDNTKKAAIGVTVTVTGMLAIYALLCYGRAKISEKRKKKNEELDGEEKHLSRVLTYLYAFGRWFYNRREPERRKTEDENLETVEENEDPVRGLHNLGNTCYFNSTMQALVHTNRTFREELQNLGTNGEYVREVLNFFNAMQPGSSQPFSPENVHRLFGKKSPKFSDFQQHDSHECLRNFLDNIRKEERDSSDIVDKRKVLTVVDSVFGGHFMTVYICKRCETPYHVCEALLDISLPIMIDAQDLAEMNRSREKTCRTIKQQTRRSQTKNRSSQTRESNERKITESSVIKSTDAESMNEPKPNKIDQNTSLLAPFQQNPSGGQNVQNAEQNETQQSLDEEHGHDSVSDETHQEALEPSDGRRVLYVQPKEQDNDVEGQQGIQQVGGEEQVGEENVGEKQVGKEQVGEEQVGEEQAGEEQVGKEQVLEEQVGKEQVGEEQVREEQVVEEQVGEEQVGEEQVGEEQVGDEQVGEEQVGKEQVGEEQVGKEQVREEQVGKEQVGEEQMGKEQVGEEQVREEQVGEEQVGVGQIGEEQVGEEQVGEEQVGEEQVGEEQVKEEQVGGGQMGEEKVGEEQMGEEQVGRGQVGGGQVGEDQVGGAQVGEEQAGEELVGEEQMGGGQVGEEQVGGGQLEKEQPKQGLEERKQQVKGERGQSNESGGRHPDEIGEGQHDEIGRGQQDTRVKGQDEGGGGQQDEEEIGQLDEVRTENEDDEEEEGEDVQVENHGQALQTSDKKDGDGSCDEYREAIENMMTPLSSPSSSYMQNSDTTREKDVTIDNCLMYFTRKEHINEEYLCNGCYGEHLANGGKDLYLTSATKQTLIFNPPAILTLHLKRFELKPGGSVKRNDRITYGELLDIAPYCSSMCLRNDPPCSNIWYSLYGVVVHHGSTLTSGHYVAYVKVKANDMGFRKLLQEKYFDRDLTRDQLVEMMHAKHDGSSKQLGDNWYCMNDSWVHKVPVREVLNQEAYLLFYERLFLD